MKSRHDYSLRLERRDGALSIMQGWWKQVCREMRLTGTIADDLELMLEEIVLNILEHGPHRGKAAPVIDILLQVGETAVTVNVSDTGRPFNPLEAAAPTLELPIEERPIGGLGLYLVKSLADELSYRRDGDWNCLSFCRYLPEAVGRSANFPSS